VGVLRDFKFGAKVEHSKSRPTDDKLSLKGKWSRHVTHFKFIAPLLSLERLRLQTVLQANVGHPIVTFGVIGCSF